MQPGQPKADSASIMRYIPHHVVHKKGMSSTHRSAGSTKQSFPLSNEENSRKCPEGWWMNAKGDGGKRGEIRKLFDV